MLRNVLEGYFDTLTEREFDTPFLCLLLEEGFFDIHFLHGNYEFGKDFIAKKIVDGSVIQFSFQSKAGNINSTDWRQIAFQCEEMRTNLLAHPNFDVRADKQVVLVTTGKLVGGAALAAQQYDERCKSIGEIGLVVWDENTLIEKLLNCDVGLTGINGEDTDFIEIITSIKKDKSDFSLIEKFSRRWKGVQGTVSEKVFHKIVLDASLIIHELVLKEKSLLACYTCLMAIRTLIYLIHKSKFDKIPEWTDKCLCLIEDIYEHLVHNLVGKILPIVDEKNGLLKNFKYNFGSIITYPVTCLQLIEHLGLYGLLQVKRGKTKEAKEVADFIVKIIQNNNVCTHPISDKYAVSFIAPLLLLTKFGYKHISEETIRKTAKWLADRYEISEAGLANFDAKEADEIKILMGYMFSFIDLPKRRESYIATIMLDLATVLGLNNLYNDMVNDFLAVRIYHCLIGTENIPEQYIDSNDQLVYSNIKYLEVMRDNNIDVVAFHHGDSNYFCELNNLTWEALSILSVLRNRHRIPLIKDILYISY